MRAVFRKAPVFFIVLLCSWAALGIAARVYSEQHPQAGWIVTAALPSFIVESIFYLGALFEETRAWLKRVASPVGQAAVLFASALLPYLVFSVLAGTFQSRAFYLLVALTAVFSFWHAVLPRRPAYETGFLIVAAAPILLHVFPRIYRSPDAHLRVDILGHLMWIRVGIASLLVLREWDPGSFSLWPRWSEWRAGALYYLAVLAPIATLALGLHDVRYAPLDGDWWRIAGIAIVYFFGFLWVIVIGEELLFRGVIERALLRRWGSAVLAIALSAILFGGAHLWFHQFPNWRRALVATLLGVACGIGYFRSGSVRVPMVTHAFVVTTWRIFFK